MLNSRFIRQNLVEFHFEAMAFFIQNHGLPKLPTPPRQLHKGGHFETLAWTDSDSRGVFDWAQDKFGAITAANQMEDFALTLVAHEGELDSQHLAAQQRLDNLMAGGNPYRQPIGRPIIYDPRDSSEPGHFYAALTLQLAELRATGFRPKTPTSPLMTRLVTLMAAAYNGQGFTLSHLPDRLSDYLTTDEDRRAVPKKVALNSLSFAACLALRVRGITFEEIVDTYGASMNKPFRKNLRRANRLIDANGETLKALQEIRLPLIPDTPQRHRPKQFT